MIVARRPDSPLAKRTTRSAASAAPLRQRRADADVRTLTEPQQEPERRPEETPRRVARIVQLSAASDDEREKQRRRLLARLMGSEGRGAISRAADEYLAEGFELPDEQEVHLQLLEHFNEDRANLSLVAMSRLLQREPPLKRPVLDQRLRRLEEHAEDPATRSLAAALRRTLRA